VHFDSTGIPTDSCFPADHLAFAQTWAASTPGGWSLEVAPAGNGELLNLCTHGVPTFILALESSRVVTLCNRQTKSGSCGLVRIGNHSSLPEALRALDQPT